MKLCENVHYLSLIKCCYFSSWFENQYGCHGSHLEKPISNLNSSATGGISMKLGGNVQYPSLTKCCYFSSWFEIQGGRLNEINTTPTQLLQALTCDACCVFMCDRFTMQRITVWVIKM